MNYLTTQPWLFDFGRNYLGARLAGSFQVLGAGKPKDLKCFSECGNRPSLDGPLPKWLQLGEPWSTQQNGRAWSFRVDTRSAGFREASLRLEFDTGSASIRIRADVTTGKPRLGDLVVCDEPFDCTTEYHAVAAFTRLMKGLDFRVHHLRALTRRITQQPRTILLHGAGLIGSSRNALPTIRRLVNAGTNLILLADKFYGGTAEAANIIGKLYGMTLRDGKERSYRSAEELVRGSERHSGAADIRRHSLTRGVERLFWHRPWPIDCVSNGALPLITDSGSLKLCYVAVAKPKGYVVMVGQSRWNSMASVGWPFDNDRLLANLLIGGNTRQ